MIKGHLIKKRIDEEHFLDMIKDIAEENINTTKHTFFRLWENERKIFKDRVIKESILKDIPALIGLQHNGNYAVFYRFEKSILKIILDIKPKKIEIVTFYIIDKLPRIEDEN